MNKPALVLTTVGKDEVAETLARTLIEERLAACVNVLAPMTSFYRWKETIERETEWQLVIKTTEDRLPALEQRVHELHPYELPEFLVLGVTAGSEVYLAWLRSETGTGVGDDR